jgi:formate hydrogenlyase subunit 3/multisubunit Na+/H+ antiporter MnhD subunit
LREHPAAGVALVVTGLVLAGMPPFGLFVSEISIAADAMNTAPSVAYGFLSVLTLAFATLLFQVLRMVLGVPRETQTSTVGPRCRTYSTAAIAVNLGALLFLGLHVPSSLQDLLGSILPFFHAEGGYFLMPDENHVSLMILAAPVFAATLSLFITNIRMLHGLNVMTMVILVVADLALWAILGRQESFTALGNLAFVDSLSVFILSIVVVLGLSCSI